MATVAGYIAGAAIGIATGGAGFVFMGLSAGAIGGAIGAAVGGIIDSMYVYPALFGTGQTPMGGARIDDFSLQTASEGSPIKRCFGPQNRVAGTVIWADTIAAEKKKSSGKSGVSSFSYSINMAIAVCVGPIVRIEKIWADGKRIYSNDGVTEKKDAGALDMTVYLGSQVQNPDPLMEGILGVSNTPGYRGIAYVVFTKLQLASFGNRIPNLTFQVRAHDVKSVGSTISDLLLEAKFDANDFDVTRVTPNVKGYTVAGPMETAKKIEPLLLAYNVDCQGRDGKLVFFDRTARDTATVVTGDLGAHSFGEAEPASVRITDNTGFDLPSEVDINYVDPAADYQRGSQRERRNNTVSPSVDTLELPVVLTATEARKVANRMLWDAWKEHLTIEFALPPSYLGIQEGDLVTVPYLTETYKVRVTEINMGANFVLVLKGRVEITTTDDVDPTADNISVTDFPVYTPPPLTFVGMDLPPLHDAEIRTWGVYFAVCCTNIADEFRGAEIYFDDNDTTFNRRPVSVAEESVIGTVDSATWSAFNCKYWDNGTEIVVTLLNGTLSSSTDLAVLNGANRAWIGDPATGFSGEVIGFVNATLIAPNQYKLTRIIRNLRNPSGFTGSIVFPPPSTVFVLLNDTVRFCPLGPSDFQKRLWFKAVPAGGNIAAFPAIELAPEYPFVANTLQPWAPCLMKAFPAITQNRIANSTVTFSWKRRTRATDRLFSQSNDPLVLNPIIEAPEKYVFSLYDAAHVLKKRYTVVDSTQLTIPFGELNSLIGLTNVPINCSVRQVSPLVGKGYELFAFDANGV